MKRIWHIRNLELSQKTGIILAFFLLLLGWMDVGFEAVERAVFAPEKGFVLWLCAIFFFLTAVYASFRARILQVIAMFLVGILFVGSHNIASLDGMLVIVVSLLFADAYGLLKKTRLTKLVVCIMLSIVVIEIYSFTYYGGFFQSGAPYVILLLYMLYLLARYNVLSATLSKRTTELGQQVEANMVFAEVGQNTSGLVHDLQNDLCRISYPRQHAQRQVRCLSEWAAPEYMPGLKKISDCLGEIKMGEKRLQRNLNIVRRIPAGFVRCDERLIDVSQYLQDLSYFLMFRREYRHAVRISIQAEKKLSWYGAEADLAALTKNLIENACQATASAGEPRQVRVVLTADTPGTENSRLYLEVINRGSIPWLQGETSLLDENVFRIGKTTKENGTGYGMVNVRRALARMNGEGTIRVEDGFVITAVVLPQRLRAAVKAAGCG